MKSAVIPFLLFLSLFFPGSTAGQGDQAVGSSSPAVNHFATLLDKRIPALMKTYNIPGVIIALVEQGRPSWSRAYGYADLAGGRPMTAGTYCRVESISKSVTAWGVMKLVEEGRLDLETPIVRYLPEWSFPAEGITVRQLLSHTAGLALGTIGVRYDPGAPRPSLEEALHEEMELIRPPGQSFSYSNTGFNLLELLIEAVSGRDFGEYMREEVLQPLGMDHAHFDWQPSFDPPVPFGYDLDGRPIPVYVYPGRAAGGLFATVGDIAAFVAAGNTLPASAGSRVLSRQSMDQLYQPVAEIGGAYSFVFDAYGLGHFIEWLPGGEMSVSHGGQGSGWMTHFQVVPATGDGIVILTNSQRSWPFFGHILNDWARWQGYRSAGMGRIVAATRVLWVLIGLLFLLGLGQGWRLGRGLIASRRRFSGLSREGAGRRLVQALIALAIVAGLMLAARQEYSFFSAVFPVAAPWLGRALALVALGLLLSASTLPAQRKSGE